MRKQRKNKYGILRYVYLLMVAIMMLTIPQLNAKAFNKDVTITSVSITSTTVVVEGSTEALAVMVQVRDASNAIVAMQSFGTTSNSFTGTITGLSLAAGDYTVYVADYEGGTWATDTKTLEASAPGGGGTGGGSGAGETSTPAAQPSAVPSAAPSEEPGAAAQTPEEGAAPVNLENPDNLYPAPQTGQTFWRSPAAFCAASALVLLVGGCGLLACMKKKK